MFPSRALLPGILVVMLALGLLVFALPAVAAQPAPQPLLSGDAAVSDHILQSSTALTYTVSLPFVTRPLPVPVLNPINNPASTESYDVTWGPLAGALRYDAQEDDDPGFLHPEASIGGPGLTLWRFPHHAVGTWYYRVKATFATGESGWSQPVSTTVIPGIAGIVTSQGISGRGRPPPAALLQRVRLLDDSRDQRGGEWCLPLPQPADFRPWAELLRRI